MSHAADGKPMAEPDRLATPLDLREALAQITEIRERLAYGQTCVGFRSLPVAASGLLAFAAAVAQWLWLAPLPGGAAAFLTLWVGVAVCTTVLAGAEMAWRTWQSRSRMTRQVNWLAVEQFLPCLVAGAVVTLLVAQELPEAVWTLPGLWAILYSLGLFAAQRQLPTPIHHVASYYLVTGTLCLAAGPHGLTAAAAMALTFGCGQLAVAAVLYWTLERPPVVVEAPA